MKRVICDSRMLSIAIADYALRGSSGELDHLEFRARRSIAYGMGHLARVDSRALAG
jgi:hypothetical protein